MSLDFKAKRVLPFVTVEEGNSCNFYYVPKFKLGQMTTDMYMVIENLTKGTVSCNCLYFAIHQKECSHMRAVKMFKEKHVPVL